ncbi:hypothetical protein WJX77_004859 [Trebouxia sp. C0004]
MAKDLEEGEIEEGELLGEVAETSAGLDEPGELSVPPSEPVKGQPDPSQDSEPTTAPVDDASTAPVPPSDLGLLGLPTYDAPFRSYGSSMAYSAYGALPYAAMAPAQFLDRRQSSIRDREHASTSYDSPRFARRQSGGPFASRQSDHRGYSPPRTHSRYDAEYDESSSFDSRQADSVPSEDESMDEGELRPVSRSRNSHGARSKRPSRAVQAIIGSIKSLTATVGVPAAMKSLETVSLDLKAALSDLQDLQQALSTSGPVRADDNTQLADMGTRFFKGLSAVHLVCNTGVGKTSNLSAAGKLVRASIEKQDMLLTASQKKELDGWTKSSKVFKALVDGEEESIQPKKPKVEPQPRTPYIPKQPRASGQKRQGKQSSQQGPKGKKQKKGAAAADIEDAPPLPPSDAPPSDDSAAEADMEGVESVPLPPLPPPSPDSLPAGSAVANGYRSGHTDTHQASVSGPLPSLSGPPLVAAPALLVTPPPPAEASDTPSRPQVGFKLQGNRRQKVHMVEGEDPTTKAMRERLQQHLAAQQLHQQQGGQLQSSLLRQAAQVPLPLPDSDTSAPGRRHSQRSKQGIQEQGHEQIPGIHGDTDGQVELQTNGQLPFGKPQLQQVHQHRRHHPAAKRKVPNDSHAPPPGLEASPHQQAPQQLPQEVPQQLPQAELPQAGLPPGLAPEPQQLQPQLQRSQSHRHVHHHRRSSRRSHRGDPATLDMIQPCEEAPQYIAGLAPYSQPALQQSGYGTDPMTDPVTQELIPEPDRSSTALRDQQYEGLAEAGGPVALANGPAPGTQAGVEVLADDVKSLLRQRKLCLVLDLDHTLINSARFSEVEPEHEALLRSHLANDAVRLPEEKRELFRLERIQMWTKLRPAVRHFLETAHQHFELWIHTNGNRSYATAIVEVLDPGGRLFGHRIISQGAAGDGVQQDLTKRLMQGLEGREPVALVVDDTSSVWGNHEENLVAVERYIYFPASRRQFGSKAKSLLETRRDETPQAGMLMTALSVLLRTHARMFRVLSQSSEVEAAGHRAGERPRWDVRQVLQDERKQVLAGVHIMFSRVIPLQDGHPEWHPMWRKAVKFGATCTTQPSDAVTHVAAYVNGTEKVYWAQRTGKFVVTPDWLNCSAMLWKRAAEAAYPVTATA